MTALRELREKVAAGEFPAYMSNRDLGWDVAILTPYEAFSGSLDAAKALHEALLPGWGWSVSDTGDVTLWPPGLIDEQNAGAVEVSGEMAPARAWLLVILDALAHLREERRK